MRLSSLQKYILLECLNSGKVKISREKFGKFYNRVKDKRKAKAITKVITKSLERLISRELLVGYGIRTPHKWFVREVRLTHKGRREAKRLLGEQRKLPFKVRN